MINALISGTLHRDPKRGTARTGAAFASVQVRTPLDNGETMMVSVIAFEPRVVEGLMLLTAGDAVCLTGQFNPKVYVDDNGESHPSAEMTAQGLLNAYQVKRKRVG